jgi:hypothetical protein
MARDKSSVEIGSDGMPRQSKDVPPNGYDKPEGKAVKGPHRSDPDFGHQASMSNPQTVKKEEGR